MDEKRKKSRERVRKHRAKMNEEKKSEKRAKDREYKQKMKEVGVIKTINELSNRQQQMKRRQWKKDSCNYRRKQSMKKEEIVKELTILGRKGSPREQAGRKVAKRTCMKMRRDIQLMETKINKKDKKIETLRKRLYHFQNKKNPFSLNLQAKENEHSDSKSHFIDPDDVQDLAINMDEEKRHSDLEVQLEKTPSIVSCVSLSKPNSAIPARSDWHGAHNFKIKIDNGDPLKKTECSVFFEQQNKLYVSKDYPFKVLVSAENVPAGSVIKATAIFSKAEHAYELVLRCPTHAQQDFVRGLATYEHFVQSFSDNSLYEKDYNTRKLSVSVPYEKPKEGETYSAYLFKLTCFSSCSGGINRRPFQVVFTLEKDQVPLGRQAIEAKVCACPIRDFKLDSEKAERIEGSNKKSKKDSTDSSNPEKVKYSIFVKDRELYLFLKQMKTFYETSAYASRLKSDAVFPELDNES